MSTRHTFTTTLTDANDNEVEVTIKFNYTKGSPDTYNKLYGWDQGYAAEIELDSCEPAEMNDVATAYLLTDQGYQEAIEVVTTLNGDY